MGRRHAGGRDLVHLGGERVGQPGRAGDPVTTAVAPAAGGELAGGDAYRSYEPAQLLRATGLRVSRPRVAVLSAVAARPHMSAVEVTLRVRATVRSVSLQTVKDVLTVCTEAGLLCRTEPAGSPAHYATNTDATRTRRGAATAAHPPTLL